MVWVGMGLNTGGKGIVIDIMRLLKARMKEPPIISGITPIQYQRRKATNH